MKDAPLSVHNVDPQISALAIALAQKPRHIPDTLFYDWISMAKESFFYHQAKAWAEEPPAEIENATARALWKMTCREIVRIVDFGYDGDTWWPLNKIYPLRAQVTGLMLAVADFTLMLRQYNVGQQPIRSVRDMWTSLDKYEKTGFPLVSTGFEIFADVILGRGWEKRFEHLLKQVKNARDAAGG